MIRKTTTTIDLTEVREAIVLWLLEKQSIILSSGATLSLIPQYDGKFEDRELTGFVLEETFPDKKGN